MQSIELKISIRDWCYIIILGAFFGFFISLFLYFTAPQLQYKSTIFFGTVLALLITLLSSILITISNNFILPKVKKYFWHIISFLFSFLSGFIGIILTLFIFKEKDYPIVHILKPLWLELASISGFLTFLIGLILYQFISMKYKNEENKNQLIEGRLKALENELNPHFLFNALNSITELIHTDKQKAENAILELSNFLRNAIDTKSVVSLQKELEMVKTYVDIENTRFQDKIKLILPSIIDDISVPKFSIQLLVENAIKHGYIGNVLNVEIVVKKESIIVKNDGKGQNNLKFGLGLTNLQKRLSLLELGSLSFEQNETMNFTIITKGYK